MLPLGSEYLLYCTLAGWDIGVLKWGRVPTPLKSVSFLCTCFTIKIFEREVWGSTGKICMPPAPEHVLHISRCISLTVECLWRNLAKTTRIQKCLHKLMSTLVLLYCVDWDSDPPRIAERDWSLSVHHQPADEPNACMTCKSQQNCYLPKCFIQHIKVDHSFSMDQVGTRSLSIPLISLVHLRGSSGGWCFSATSLFRVPSTSPLLGCGTTSAASAAPLWWVPAQHPWIP